jgi:hypothetical protein
VGVVKLEGCLSNGGVPCSAGKDQRHERYYLGWDNVVWLDYPGINLLFMNRAVNAEYSIYIAENIQHFIKMKSYPSFNGKNYYLDNVIRAGALRKCYLSVTTRSYNTDKNLKAFTDFAS